MFEQVVPLALERHRHKKVRQTVRFDFAADFHIAYVTVQEFARAASTYPIVFLEDPPKDSFRPVVLMGLETGRNLFVSAEGQWNAAYIPAMIRRYPFALSKAAEEGQFVVCVDEASSLISDTEGAPLFDEQGQATEVIEHVKRYLSELQQMDMATQEFTRFLQSHQLLSPLNMRINASAQERNITGCFVVHEERLNALSDELFLQMRSKGYLPAIYGHLMSLPQIERLVQLNRARTPAAPTAPQEAPAALETAPAAKRKPAARKRRSTPPDQGQSGLTAPQ